MFESNWVYNDKSSSNSQQPNPKIGIDARGSMLEVKNHHQDMLDNLLKIVEEEIRSHETYLAILRALPKTYTYNYNDIMLKSIEDLKSIIKSTLKKDNGSVFQKSYLLTQELCRIKERLSSTKQAVAITITNIITTTFERKNHSLLTFLKAIVIEELKDSKAVQQEIAILKKLNIFGTSTVCTNNTETSTNLNHCCFSTNSNNLDESENTIVSRNGKSDCREPEKEHTKDNSADSLEIPKDCIEYEKEMVSCVKSMLNVQRDISSTQKEVISHLTNKIKSLQSRCPKCNILKTYPNLVDCHDKITKTTINYNNDGKVMKKIGGQSEYSQRQTEKGLCNINLKDVDLIHDNNALGTVLAQTRCDLLAVGSIVVDQNHRALKTILDDTKFKLSVVLQRVILASNHGSVLNCYTAIANDKLLFIQTHSEIGHTVTAVQRQLTPIIRGGAGSTANQDKNLLNHIKHVKSFVEEEIDQIISAQMIIEEHLNDNSGDNFTLVPFPVLQNFKYTLQAAKKNLAEIDEYLRGVDTGDSEKAKGHFVKIGQYLIQYMTVRATSGGIRLWQLMQNIKTDFLKTLDEIKTTERMYLVQQSNTLKLRVLELQRCISTKTDQLQKLKIEEDSAVLPLDLVSQMNKTRLILDAEAWITRLSQYYKELLALIYNTELDNNSLKSRLTLYNNYVFEAGAFKTTTDDTIRENICIYISKLTQTVLEQQTTLDGLQKEIHSITKVLNPFYTELEQGKKPGLLAPLWSFFSAQPVDTTEQKLKKVFSYVQKIQKSIIDLEEDKSKKEQAIDALKKDKLKHKARIEEQLAQERKKLHENEEKLKRVVNIQKTSESTAASLTQRLKESESRNESVNKTLEENRLKLSECKTNLEDCNGKLERFVQQREATKDAISVLFAGIKQNDLEFSNQLKNITSVVGYHSTEVTVQELRDSMEKSFIQSSITTIRDIEKQAEFFGKQIGNFNGTATGVLYLDVKEKLLRLIVNLDNVISRNKEDIIAERRRVSSKVTGLLDTLEMKVKG